MLKKVLNKTLANKKVFILILNIVLFITLINTLPFERNTATAALLIPMFATIGTHLNISPVTMALLVSFSTSCACMLPAATPPNALVYSTGHIPQKTMLKVGFALNIIVAFILSGFASFIW